MSGFKVEFDFGTASFTGGTTKTVSGLTDHLIGPKHSPTSVLVSPLEVYVTESLPSSYTNYRVFNSESLVTNPSELGVDQDAPESAVITSFVGENLSGDMGNAAYVKKSSTLDGEVAGYAAVGF